MAKHRTTLRSKAGRSETARALDSVRGLVTDIIPMTEGQEEHLKRVKDFFEVYVDGKYRAGQVRHGGDLHHNSAHKLLNNAIEEAVDQVVYLVTLKEVLGV